MTEERRYDDDEVREIFGAAAESRDRGAPTPSSGEGLTLSELQEIGLEVGLSRERIAEAASALDVRRSMPPVRTHFGLPLSVGRTVDLPRAPTDAEWAMLVAELRRTFNARGNLGGHGSLREWTNGNLHAYVEPTETGFRLRLGTLKGSAVPMTRTGLALAGFGLFMSVFLFVTGDAERAASMLMVFGFLGGGFLASSLLRLPAWAREREEQMEYIAERARSLIGPE